MAKEKIEPALLFIDPSKMVLFCPSFANGLSLAFPEGVIKNMEITDSQVIYKWIEDTCQAYKLPKLSVLIVYTQQMYFQKQFAALPADKLEEEDKKFCHATPFDRVTTHAYKAGTGMVIVSINRDFYDTISQGLTKCGFEVLGLVPQFLLAPLVGTQGLTPKSIRLLYPKLESLAEQSVVTMRQIPQTLQEKQEYLSTHYQGVIVGVFVAFLIGVFALTGFVLRRQFQSNRAPSVTPPPAVAPAQVPAETTETAPAINTEQPTTATGSATASTLQISIRYPESNASGSATLVNALGSAGYSQVNREAVDGLGAQSALILFASSVPPSARTSITSVVAEIVDAPSVQESTELTTDVVITLPR